MHIFSCESKKWESRGKAEVGGGGRVTKSKGTDLIKVEYATSRLTIL